MNACAASIFRKIIVYLLFGVLMLACSISSATAPSKGASSAENTNAAPGAPGGPSTTSTEIPTASTDIPTPVPGPLDWLLGLRSVIIEQSTTHPDGSSYSYSIEIDRSGNMRVTENHPVVMYTKDLPDPNVVDPTKLSGAETLYVMGGKAYEADSSNPDWKTTPVDDDYVQTLSEKLNGADGPGLWLDVLTDNAFTAAGNENTGGFEADKYTVNGQFNGQTISGTIWIEPKTKALVKADLSVPAALMDPTDQSGMFKITLDTHQAEVEPVTLPDISTPTDTPTKGP